jgi:hypothetical protein
VRVIQYKIHPSQLISLRHLISIEKTPERFCSFLYRQRKNPAKAFVHPFIMEEGVAGTGTVAPVEGIESIDIGIDMDNLIDDIDPTIGADYDV